MEERIRIRLEKLICGLTMMSMIISTDRIVLRISVSVNLQKNMNEWLCLFKKWKKLTNLEWKFYMMFFLCSWVSFRKTVLLPEKIKNKKDKIIISTSNPNGVDIQDIRDSIASVDSNSLPLSKNMFKSSDNVEPFNTM